jgi:hypothetical protein
MTFGLPSLLFIFSPCDECSFRKHLGIFGKLSAYAAGVEEQGRTSLHRYIVLWVQNYYQNYYILQ